MIAELPPVPEPKYVLLAAKVLVPGMVSVPVKRTYWVWVSARSPASRLASRSLSVA